MQFQPEVLFRCIETVPELAIEPEVKLKRIVFVPDTSRVPSVLDADDTPMALKTVVSSVAVKSPFS
ncbi:hypothetical protein JCM19233_1456 [Vibrio astriarenae]|nr:hypothetical protein JCM19233_1456 [Vibrio sp. C7]